MSRFITFTLSILLLSLLSTQSFADITNKERSSIYTYYETEIHKEWYTSYGKLKSRDVPVRVKKTSIGPVIKKVRVPKRGRVGIGDTDSVELVKNNKPTSIGSFGISNANYDKYSGKDFIFTKNKNERFLGERVADFYIKKYGPKEAWSRIKDYSDRITNYTPVKNGHYSEAIRNAEHHLYAYKETFNSKHPEASSVFWNAAGIGYNRAKIEIIAYNKLTGKNLFGLNYTNSYPSAESVIAIHYGARKAISRLNKENG